MRETFLSYFESQEHSRMASASLIPVGDPTLLFTSAGMVQFKYYFTGEAEPPNRRLTTSQKCFRTPDIEEVGDATHNTLFEMLGNFSIGDYFKARAVDFAVELMTEGYGIPLEMFAAAVHETDDETRELWVNKGIPRERVYSYGDDENWWGPAGDEGPCGPCSELHYDYGPGHGCEQDDCVPNCKNYKDNGEACDRYVELVEPGVHAVLPPPGRQPRQPARAQRGHGHGVRATGSHPPGRGHRDTRPTCSRPSSPGSRR